MARFAGLRCSLELNLRLTCGNLVASAAGYRAVDTQQRERRTRVIETVDVDPRPGAMASLTAKLRAIWPSFLHPLFELPVMWIDMACSACAVGEAEGQNFIFSVGQAHFMAIRASDRRVRAR